MEDGYISTLDIGEERTESSHGGRGGGGPIAYGTTVHRHMRRPNYSLSKLREKSHICTVILIAVVGVPHAVSRYISF